MILEYKVATTEDQNTQAHILLMFPPNSKIEFQLALQSFNLSIIPSFLDKIVLINDPGYLPIDDDIIRVRRSTVGVIRKLKLFS